MTNHNTTSLNLYFVVVLFCLDLFSEETGVFNHNKRSPVLRRDRKLALQNQIIRFNALKKTVPYQLNTQEH